jgi:predicted nucleic acid-binding protein
VIVDTSVWFDYFAGVSNAETGWLDVEMGKQRLGVTDLILCEILQGTRSDREFRVLKGAMLKYEVFATGSREMAMVSSENYRLLRKQGCTPRKAIACWIATFCLREGHALLHHDRDFEPFEKYLALRVIHP